ncbi:MAG: hypothetical protein NC930_08840 [Candidatus Omnitrophica bacterium]|nr:hypothetical protein [Candidatus Omnitrophota bacterium]
MSHVSSETEGKKAVFTMVRDEGVFLPIWLRYYSRVFDPDDIYVLDHLTSDGNIERAREIASFQVVSLDYPSYNDFAWYTQTVKDKQRELLKYYDIVLFTEPDEIVYHTRGLGVYIEGFRKNAIRCFGYEIFHKMDEEPPIDLTCSILSQRKYWWMRRHWNKPLLSRVPLNWIPGFHRASNCFEIDPELLLVHLHRFDFGLTYQRKVRISQYRRNKQRSEPSASRNGPMTEAQFREFFFEPLREDRVEFIPSHIREADFV